MNNIRKFLLIFIMLIIFATLFFVVYQGIIIGDFKVYSYKKLERNYENLQSDIDSYELKNTSGISSKKDKLSNSIKEYEVQKNKYEEVLKQKQIELQNYDQANCYNIDFIWAKAGNYAKDNNLDIELNITKNVLDEAEVEYILADLNFTVKSFVNLEGYQNDPFIDTAEFINDLETDSKLEFEIRNFYMVKEKTKVMFNQGAENQNEQEAYILKTTFTVYNVPLIKDTLTVLTSKDVTINASLSQDGKGDVQNINQDGTVQKQEEQKTNISNTTF